MLPLSVQMKDLWEQVVTLRHQIAQFSKNPFPAPRMNAAATPTELRELEHHLGLSLPPSYREFLSLYNGVENFDYDMPLLSTHQIIDGAPPWVEDIAEEFPEVAQFFIAGSTHSYAGSYFFDSRVVTPAGELEVVYFSLKMDEARWPSFAEMLQDMIGRLQIILAAERADRAQLSD